jgi:hypothetical protein
MLVQPIDQFEDEDSPALERTKGAPLLGARGIDQTELGEGFLGGAARMEQEAAEIADGPPAARFRYVRDHRQGGSDQLIPAGEGAGAAEGLGKLSALGRHTLCHLGHQESAGVGAEHHALTMASVVRAYVIIPTPSLDAFVQRYRSTFVVLDGSVRRCS